MDEVLRQGWADPPAAEAGPRRPRVAADWPLMGDIVSHRAGWPEHLIRWRKAAGEAPPGLDGLSDGRSDGRGP